MVRRAKVPGWIKHGGRFNHRELSGWPDGIAYSPRQRKQRKKRTPKKRQDGSPSVDHTPVRINIGKPL